MNTIVTSKEAILSTSRKIVMEQGLSAINMRIVATACNVAVGSLYNYFPSKADLINATVEDVWKDIFHITDGHLEFTSFIDCLSWFLENIREGCRKYPGFFTFHSMSFASEDKEKGRQMMDHYFGHIRRNLLLVLKKDPKVRSDAFNEELTPEDFVELIFMTAVTMLLQNHNNYKSLLQMAANCIY